MPAKSTYHTRQERQCKYCGEPLPRYITKIGRNKGFRKTCGSSECRSKACSNNGPKSGKDHPKWIVDRSSLKYRPRTEQNWWRKAIFERDNYTCKECGQYGGRLQADHILPYSTFPEARWNLDNGRTLCVECHKKTPTYARKINRVTISHPNQQPSNT